MKTKQLVLFTLVFSMMVAMVGAVSAQDDETQGRGKRGGRGFGGDSTIIADATGLEHDAIREALRDGATLAELIEANGVDVDTVIASLVTEATNNISEKVDAGDITQERADEILESLEDRVTDRINGTFERPADGEGRPEGRRGRRGLGGDVEDTDTTDDA